jgi:hypothetical protein
LKQHRHESANPEKSVNLEKTPSQSLRSRIIKVSGKSDRKKTSQIGKGKITGYLNSSPKSHQKNPPWKA